MVHIHTSPKGSSEMPSMSAILTHVNFGEPHPAVRLASIPSTLKRMHMDSSEEDFQERIDERYYPFRIGWPKPPPMPLDTRNAEGLNGEYSHKIEECKYALQKAAVPYKRLEITYRLPRDLADMDHDGMDFATLLVTLDMSHQNLSLLKEL
jgi:hypothetical protein